METLAEVKAHMHRRVDAIFESIDDEHFNFSVEERAVTAVVEAAPDSFMRRELTGAGSLALTWDRKSA